MIDSTTVQQYNSSVEEWLSILYDVRRIISERAV